MVMSYQMFVNCNLVANLWHYNEEQIFFFPQECPSSGSLYNEVSTIIAKIVRNRFLQKRKLLPEFAVDIFSYDIVYNLNDCH